MAITNKGFHKLAAFHGLDPEKHSDGDVDDAIKNAVTEDDLNDLTNRAQAAEGALVEHDLAKYANRIGTDAKVIATWKKNLLANRDETVALLEALPEATPNKNGAREPIHNRKDARQPETLRVGAEQAAAEQKRADAVKNRADSLVRTEKLTPMAAYAKAESEIPAVQK